MAGRRRCLFIPKMECREPEETLTAQRCELCLLAHIANQLNRLIQEVEGIAKAVASHVARHGGKTS